MLWIDVVGYENLFQVSSNGDILSKRTNKTLKQSMSRTGYYTLSTRVGRKTRCSKML